MDLLTAKSIAKVIHHRITTLGRTSRTDDLEPQNQQYDNQLAVYFSRLFSTVGPGCDNLDYVNLTMILFDRVWEACPSVLDGRNAEQTYVVFVTTLIVMLKFYFIEKRSTTLQHWSETSGISVQTLNNMELVILTNLDWNLNINFDEYTDFVEAIQDEITVVKSYIEHGSESSAEVLSGLYIMWYRVGEDTWWGDGIDFGDIGGNDDVDDYDSDDKDNDMSERKEDGDEDHGMGSSGERLTGSTGVSQTIETCDQSQKES
ncbi:hypothetical protein HDU76_007659 [Blyttiomyces sp. JEL0837]|nr:hypothetical protein HDU76_007659 [Blyttiomyces sp. JEL0837]